MVSSPYSPDTRARVHRILAIVKVLLFHASFIPVVLHNRKVTLEMSDTQNPVVRKPINANPRLKVNRGFQLAH